jgi:hypothetical protein
MPGAPCASASRVAASRTSQASEGRSISTPPGTYVLPHVSTRSP